MNRRIATVALAVTGLTLASALPAIAAGGALPSQAPTITIGTEYEGDSSPGRSGAVGAVEFWRLPSVVEGDQVTVDAASRRVDGLPVRISLAGDLTDANWSAPGALDDLSVGPGQDASAGGTRMAFVAKRSSDAAFLVSGDDDPTLAGPYRVSVVSILHGFDLGDFVLYGMYQRVHRSTVISGQVMRGDGEVGAPDGTLVRIVVTKGSRSWKRSGRVTGSIGEVAVPLRLPRAAVGRVTMTITASAEGYADGTYRKRLRVRR